MTHVSLRDRNIRAKLDASSSVNKIFDPDEMLRKDTERRSAQQPYSAYNTGMTTGSSFAPVQHHAPPVQQPSYGSNTNWSGIASTSPTLSASPPTVSPVGAEQGSQADRRDKQKQMRQRIREQYGLYPTESAAETKQK